ncbi:MAG: Flagellin protein FlaA [Candidatus Ozemobacter sibiricus]|uniref:Flagellin n=1 Tax=Candidatus Ozemobacter sibiricus TaxID=2268124 RepID=A0A367ZNV7_9BACT|nr:MAG: Flagellin protein FlaA [Candidatus Ozemobacter sibiricus]
MSLCVNQNVLSIKTHGILTQTSTRLEKSIEKLSSGLRINRAADDAAGLAISEKLRRQIRGLSRAVLNAQDGISMIQSAEGALNETHSILQRMRELAIQASNDTLTTNDRLEIQKEVLQLRNDIDRIAYNTEFNTKKLLDGSQTGLFTGSSKYFQGLVTGQVVGGDYSISLALAQAGAAQMLRSQIFTLRSDGTLADGSATLDKVAQFYDNNGQFILATPKTLTLNSWGKQTQITIDGGFTLGDLVNKIDTAIRGANGLDQKNATIQFINPTTGNDGGYFQVTAGVMGERGVINFAGDQGLLQALGVGTIRAASNGVIKGTAMDPFGNMVTAQTNDSRFYGMIPGIDVMFDSQPGQVAGYKGIETGLSLAANATFTINIYDSSGANAGTQTLTVNAGRWTLRGIQRALTAQISIAVGADSDFRGLEAQISDGEIKLVFNPTTTGISSRIDLSGNSQAIGMRNGTYYTSVTGSKDKAFVLEGISQYDPNATGGQVAISIVDGQNNGVGVGVGNISIYTATDDAQVADMVEIGAMLTYINNTLAAGGSEVRADRVGDSLAFTSTLLGRLTYSDGTYSESRVNFAISVGAATDTANLRDKLGLSAINVIGDGLGDSNIRAHVVTNSPQFHIGADQGQVMKVNMGNMSAKALGVDVIDMTSIEGASLALGRINDAIDKVSAERSKLGAFQNRLEFAINNLRNTHSNLTSAESRLRDADIAQEMIEFTRNQIVSQSGTAMLAQANLVPQGVLQLLR